MLDLVFINHIMYVHVFTFLLQQHKFVKFLYIKILKEHIMYVWNFIHIIPNEIF